MEIGKFFLCDFRIDNELDETGGEAIVSKARHPRLGEVAIKRWTRKAYNFYNEIKFLIQNCDHPNIIQFLGMLMNNESKCIGYIMPYMSSGSLHDIIHNKTEKYDERQTSSWITQICCGLSHLHFKKIIHRDIKPRNILLGKSRDDIKLTDFGMARSLEGINHTLTQLGTPLYMAPEIFKGGKYDFSADIYSLAITIWEILHRRIPYDHITGQVDLRTEISNGKRPQLDSNLSKEASDLLTMFPNILAEKIFDFRCWHPDTSKRPNIDYILEFSITIRFFSMSLENSASIEEGPNKQTVLLLGGDDGSKCLDSLTVLQNNGENDGNWKELNIKLPYPVYCHGAQFLNNYLYIFGGRNEKDEVLNSAYKLARGHKWLNNRLKWDKIKEMNEKRTNISNSNVILNDRIWVIGGSNGIEGPLKSVEMYDPQTNIWTNKKPMNQCRNLAAAAVVHAKIFCCGGGDEGGNFLKSAECYDSSSDIWTFISDMPGPNAGCGIVVMDAHLIVIGGKFNIRKYFLNSVWVLDTTDKKAKWTEKEPSMPHPLSHFSIAEIDNKIFVCGGDYFDKKYSKCYVTDDVVVFDGEAWRNGPELPTYLDSAPAVVIPMEFARSLLIE